MSGTAEAGRTLGRLEQALKDGEGALTRSGRIIAAYLRDNLVHLPFETGAEIASKTGVSEMSVIRFVRSLGFASLKELKDELRPAGLPGEDAVDDALERFHVGRAAFGGLEEGLELELRAVIEAYQLTGLERWQAAVDLLASRREVHVVGFQASKGLALDFATRLKYARPGVRFAEGTSGVYSEVLEAETGESCLLLVDTVAYARKGLKLARAAKHRGIPLVIVTDRFSNWAYDFTPLVLQGSTHVKAFWDSTASLSVILNLLVNSVANCLGAAALRRFEAMKELGQHFDEFEMPGDRDGRD